MGIKDEFIDYQRQRHAVLGCDMSGFGSDGSDFFGTSASRENAELRTASGGDGHANAAGTVITVGNAGFADVLVGDYIVHGDLASFVFGEPPVTRRINARTDTTVTVAALPGYLRNRADQEYAVTRYTSSKVARFTGEGGMARHSFPIPSHWDTHDDLSLKLHVVMLNLSANDTQTFVVQYGVSTPGKDRIDTGNLVGLEDGANTTYDFDAALNGTIVELDVPGRIPASAIKKGDWLTVAVELDDSDSNINSSRNLIGLYALVFEYTPRLTVGHGADVHLYRADDRRYER